MKWKLIPITSLYSERTLFVIAKINSLENLMHLIFTLLLKATSLSAWEMTNIIYNIPVYNNHKNSAFIVDAVEFRCGK